MRRILLWLLLLLALVGAGCGRSGSEQGGAGAPAPAGFPVTLDTPGGKVEIAQRPTRVVSLSPTATEMLFAIDAGDQVVAVDDQSTYPPDAPKTKLSGYQPNVEAIAGYRPDLVVFANDTGDLAASLRRLAIPALALPAATRLDDSYAQIQQLGKATGHTAEAERLVTAMRGEIQQIVTDAKLERPLTYYHELDKSLFSATSKTFIGQLYAQLGLQNIADKADKEGSGYPQLSAEYVVKADPDLIFLADTKCCAQSPATVAARAGWEEVRAVKDGAVVALDDDVASRWGPRVVDFLRVIAAKLKTLEAVGS
jgi:iron complex transport system substrate-binding protein